MKNDTAVKKIIAALLLVSALFMGDIVTGQPADSGKHSLQIQFSHSIDGYGKNAAFNSPLAFCLDEKHDELLVADTGNDAIGIFAAGTGEFKGRLNSAIQLRSPCGIAVDDGGSIYIACSDSAVIEIFDFKGTHLGSIDISEGRQKMPVKPGKLFWDDATEELYVIDRANQQVLVCKDKKLQSKIQPFPAYTGGDGDWKNTPMLQDIAVGAGGKIYVISAVGNAVTVLDRKGNVIASFGRHGDTADTVSFPIAVSIDKKDRLWIIDNFRHCITIFDSRGTYVTTCGVYGTDRGNLFFPSDIIVREDTLFVLEKGAERAQVFTVTE